MNQSSKVCSSCGTEKSMLDFHKCKRGLDGLHSQCKTCRKEKNATYRRSIPGLVSGIYSHQIGSSRKRGMNLPSYSKLELLDWIKNTSTFDKLYSDWINSGYDTKLVPSIDRLDDYKPYTLDNIQLVTWDYNNNKHHRDVLSGRNTKHSKCVVSYLKDDTLVNEYHSAMEAQRVTGIGNAHIIQCCKGNRYSAGGFKWKYKNKRIEV